MGTDEIGLKTSIFLSDSHDHCLPELHMPSTCAPKTEGELSKIRKLATKTTKFCMPKKAHPDRPLVRIFLKTLTLR